jgi:DNA-binding XRE family transcriptional regulator
MLIGQIVRDGAYWAAFCDVIGAATQGRSKPDAMWMLGDCLSCKFDRPGFVPQVTELGPLGDRAFVVRIDANRPEVLFAEVLKYQREMRRLSRAQVAARFGCSQAKYAAIEDARIAPSMDVLDELLAAAAPDLHVGLGTRADLLTLYASASSPSGRGRRAPHT